MTTFLLVRHASHDLLGATLAGWTPGIHLNARGWAEAELLAERLVSASPIDAIYASPLERSQETAQPVARRLGLSVLTLPGIGELRFGDWTGRSFEELELEPAWTHFNAHRSIAPAPGGECMADVERRVVETLLDLHRRHPQGSIVLVSHGDVIKAAVAHVLETALDRIDRFEIEPASITRFVFGRGGGTLLGLNETVTGADLPTFSLGRGMEARHP